MEEDEKKALSPLARRRVIVSFPRSAHAVEILRIMVQNQNLVNSIQVPKSNGCMLYFSFFGWIGCRNEFITFFLVHSPWFHNNGIDLVARTKFSLPCTCMCVPRRSIDGTNEGSLFQIIVRWWWLSTSVALGGGFAK